MSDRMETRGGRRHFGRVWVALILIGIGGVLTLRNLGFTLPHNWWSLILLIPAVAAGWAAWRAYNREGRVTAASAGPFAGAVALLLLIVAFLLDASVNWDLIGPIVLILLGLGMLARRFQ